MKNGHVNVLIFTWDVFPLIDGEFISICFNDDKSRTTLRKTIYAQNRKRTAEATAK